MRRVWLDVGAHGGGRPLEVATEDDSVLVYGFEPNVRIAARNAGLRPNYVVVAAAVAEVDGVAPFHVADADTGSSLLPVREDNARRWRGGALTVVATVPVPTVRLDTFMDAAGVDGAEWLFVDAQGADLSVLKSAGRRLVDVERVRVEVAVTSYPVYLGAATKREMLDYLKSFGFTLTEVEPVSDGQEEYLSFTRSCTQRPSGRP